MNDIIQNPNCTQYSKGMIGGFYESYFLRANHPSQLVAFWIRYTIFNPNGHPENAIGEIWATYFDGTTGKHVSVKEEYPVNNCEFNGNSFQINMNSKSQLSKDKLAGKAKFGNNTISWNLSYKGNEKPLFLLAKNLYTKKIPKAKSLVALPMAVFNGGITVNGKKKAIRNWTGSQNHNWGTKHTDHYAWGQVAGFDNADSFLEIGTARLKFGPLWTPFMTVVVLRHKGKEYCLNTVKQSLKAKGSFTYFKWNFESENNEVKIKGEITADRKDFVGLTYYNPPGGIKYCLNSKIAACILEIDIKDKNGTHRHEVLSTKSRAAFEILTDDADHGVKMYV